MLDPYLSQIYSNKKQGEEQRKCLFLERNSPTLVFFKCEKEILYFTEKRLFKSEVLVYLI